VQSRRREQPPQALEHGGVVIHQVYGGPHAGRVK
jgi:hypothetical protein